MIGQAMAIEIMEVMIGQAKAIDIHTFKFHAAKSYWNTRIEYRRIKYCFTLSLL